MKHLPVYGGEDLRARRETRELCHDAVLRGVPAREIASRVGLGLDAMHASLREKGFGGGAVPACASGCSACCRGNRIEVTPPEVDLIVRHLRETLDGEALHRMTDRISSVSERATSTEAVREAGLPCAFLEDETCSIYEVRPLACRHAHSTDPRACASSTPAVVPQNTTLAAHTAALILGYREAFVHAARPMAAYELHAATELLLRASSDADASEELLGPSKTKTVEELLSILGHARRDG